LLDAYEYSERIVTDFTDVIDELEERKRQIVRDVETSDLLRQTTDTFFEFMEKRFMPDIAIRLSADSVEKHRDEIQSLIQLVKDKDDIFKAAKERELRKFARELLDKNEQEKSLLYKILDKIDLRIRNASDYMLPKLHRSLRSFIQRVEIIIGQLSFIHSGHQSLLLKICQTLPALSEHEREARLEKAGKMMGSVSLRVPDASDLKLHEKRLQREVNTQLEQVEALTVEQRKELFLRNLLDESFTYNSVELHKYIKEAMMQGHRIHTSHLPVKDTKELIMFVHAIEVGSAVKIDSEFYFIVRSTGNRVEHEYFSEMDEFIIELKETEHDH
jgi:hypothetical protein